MAKNHAQQSKRKGADMNDNYILMHKDKQCGVLAVDRYSGALTEFCSVDDRYTPFLGNADKRSMSIWWNHRAVPGSRKDMEEVIRRAGCETNTGYLAKNLALSLADTYWICPIDLELSWDDVDLRRSILTDQGTVALRSGTSYDPNASLGGQMNKYWDMSGDVPLLVKRASEHYGQQSINELFAAAVHEKQSADVPYVIYRSMGKEDSSRLCCCEAFTSDKLEFIPAFEVLRSRKLRAGRSDIDSYIDICEEHGINRAAMQRFMDYLILSDFAISNTDEHLQNFGVLRDTETMEIVGPAPIFDSGNSMFFNETRSRPLSRAELLAREISSLHTSEEKMLKHVSDKTVIDPGLLPSPDEVKRFYKEYGIPEIKAEFIAGSYNNKIAMLKDFQKGVAISLYHEQQREKN